VNDKRKNEQVERFFQHNPIEDPLYLKKYVKEHPDHKMAWYLLGREYAANGKDAKATYCFAQAGEIYEAFERQKVAVDKDDLEKALQANLSAAAAKPKRKTRAKWKWGVLAAMLLFMYIPGSMDSETNQTQRPEYTADTTTASNGVRGKETASEESANKTRGENEINIYYSEGNWSQKLAEMIVPKEGNWNNSLLVEGYRTSDNEWIEWYKSPKILLGVEHSEASKDQSQIQYYDPNLCSCEPGDASKASSIVKNWNQESEEAVILASAIAAYERKTGTLPQKAEQLLQPYPGNLLPGITTQMQAMFPELLKQKSEGLTAGQPSGSLDISGPAGSPQPTGNQKANQAKASLTSPLQEPLQILVDKEKHLLAIVSGKFILRSYPVGLGGDRTPEGEFVISEKVRNPNGKSNGEFGSRGMTLSDTLFAIHGTNKPASVGKDESLGCVRMLKEDLEELYDMVPQQTTVRIGKGIISNSVPNDGTGKPDKPYKAPLQTNDTNPKKIYKWLD
jgi:lipoprotein-anchoring transpeptidase ErfK/SrfK